MSGRAEIHRVPERFNRFVAARDMAVLDEFAADADSSRSGPKAGEVATGREELAALFTRLFARRSRSGDSGTRIDVAHLRGNGWFLDDGVAILDSAARRRKIR